MSDPTPLAYPASEELQPAAQRVSWPPPQIYWLHALLFLLTCLTTLVVGVRMRVNLLRNQPAFSLDDQSLPLFPWRFVLDHPSRLKLGAPFAATLMLILLAHEMGHYLYCKRYRVWATLPFFIPAPVLSLFGTLGAFIRIRSPIRSRTALFDIGIAGPIAGFVVSLGVLCVSLGLSQPISAWVHPDPHNLQLGLPAIFEWVRRFVAWLNPTSVAHLPFNRVLLHPCAIAAWVGMFATSLNLLPGGQLDGGHIVYSLAPRAHKFVSRLTILVLLPMAYFLWPGWLLWAILLQLSSLRHPQVAELPRVSGVRVWLALFALAMLALTITPAPILHSSVPEMIRQYREQ